MQSSVVESLRAGMRRHSAEGEFVAADLAGADLSGVSLSLVSLAHARLDGADLTRAQLTLVDLRGASLAGACLDHARFELVDAGMASFTGVRAAGSVWAATELTGTDFSNAGLVKAVIRNSRLQSARLDGADLSHGMFVSCSATGASFRGTRLLWTNTSESTFSGVDFTDAKQFFLCREIVAEVLRREIGDDFERAKLVGALLAGPQWCYSEWKDMLESRPEYRDLALRVFDRYPESGFSDALRAGWRPKTSNNLDAEATRVGPAREAHMTKG